MKKNKFDVKVLGIKKPIEINVTNSVVEKVAKANLAITKSYDLDNKDDNTIMKEALAANSAKKEILKDVLGLSDEQIEKIDEEVNTFDFQMWFTEFTQSVFMVRNYGMTAMEVEAEQKKQKKSHHTEE